MFTYEWLMNKITIIKVFSFNESQNFRSLHDLSKKMVGHAVPSVLVKSCVLHNIKFWLIVLLFINAYKYMYM